MSEDDFEAISIWLGMLRILFIDGFFFTLWPMRL